MFSAGDEGHRIGLAALYFQHFSEPKIDAAGNQGQQQADVDLLELLRVNHIVTRLAENSNARQKNHSSFKTRREEFNLSVTIGVVVVFGFGGEVEAIQRESPGHNIDNTFKRVGQDSVGIGEPPGQEFEGHEAQANGKCQDLQANVFAQNDCNLVQSKPKTSIWTSAKVIEKIRQPVKEYPYIWRMQLKTSYRQIVSISLPIMLGSAAQNVIALTDSVFLYHLGENDFAAIGFVGVFYLIIAAIGYGFSRGGQILIARRLGERNPLEVGHNFYTMFYFELALALVMFLFMQYGCYYFFQLMVDSEIIFEKSLQFLEYRSWGVFFAYAGVSIVALYTGAARTTFIMIDTAILATVNIALDYALIFGHWGFPAMGIAGAGLASTIAEAVAFLVFVLYMLFDKGARKWHIFSLPKFDLRQILQLYKLSLPIVAQAFVGMGSWFIFFGIVENLGERQLAITNLVRMVYLVLSIPTWGFSAGINTMVSNFIGNRKRQAVVPIVVKTAWLSWVATMLITLPIVLFPHFFLYPLLGNDEAALIDDANQVFYLLVLILSAFSIGAVMFNGLIGAGATWFGLKLQFFCAIGYLIYIYFVVNFSSGGLLWAWASEIFYWLAMLGLTIWYLRSKRWHALQW